MWLHHYDEERQAWWDKNWTTEEVPECRSDCQKGGVMQVTKRELWLTWLGNQPNPKRNWIEAGPNCLGCAKITGMRTVQRWNVNALVVIRYKLKWLKEPVSVEFQFEFSMSVWPTSTLYHLRLRSLNGRVGIGTELKPPGLILWKLGLLDNPWC